MKIKELGISTPGRWYYTVNYFVEAGVEVSGDTTYLIEWLEALIYETFKYFFSYTPKSDKSGYLKIPT